MIPYEEFISGPVCNFFKAETGRADGRFMKACHFEARLRRPLLGFQLRRADLISRRASNSSTAGLARPMTVLQRRALISLVYHSQWPLYQSQWPFYQGLQFLSKGCGGASKGRSDIAPHKQLINGRTLLFYQGTLEQRQFIKANGRFMKANCRCIKGRPRWPLCQGQPSGDIITGGQPQWPFYESRWPF